MNQILKGKKRTRINNGMKHLYKLSSIFVVAVFLVLCGTVTHASEVYDATDGTDLSKSPEYKGVLKSYTLGDSTDDVEASYQTYKTYYVVHDGATNVTRQMSLKKGLLNVVLYGQNGYTGSVRIYSDAACSTEIKRLNLTSACEKTAAGSYTISDRVYIPESQTYFVEFTNSTSAQGVLQFSTQQYSAANQLLAEEPIVSYVDPNIGDTYLNISVVENGYITIEPTFYSSGEETDGNVTFTLLDSNKKAISVARKIGTDEKAFAEKACYGVSVGNYWLRIKSETPKLFKVDYSNISVNEMGGRTRKKATVLKNKKWYTGKCVYQDTTTQGDYFKFTLKKPMTVNLSMKGNVVSGKIFADVYGTTVNGHFYKVSVNRPSGSCTYKIRTSTMKKLPAGTYYVKIKKDTKKSSGNYKIRLTLKK